VGFTALNAVLLRIRISTEDAALDSLGVAGPQTVPR
jgi:hypothetical protein